MSPGAVLLFGKTYWQRVINYEALVNEDAKDQQDLNLIQFIETVKEAWDAI